MYLFMYNVHKQICYQELWSVFAALIYCKRAARKIYKFKCVSFSSYISQSISPWCRIGIHNCLTFLVLVKWPPSSYLEFVILIFKCKWFKIIIFLSKAISNYKITLLPRNPWQNSYCPDNWNTKTKNMSI